MRTIVPCEDGNAAAADGTFFSASLVPSLSLSVSLSESAPVPSTTTSGFAASTSSCTMALPITVSFPNTSLAKVSSPCMYASIALATLSLSNMS